MSSTDSGSIFEIAGLVVDRGKRRVLSVEELNVSEGEILAILGPNGAGKSTLLSVMAGVLSPSAGTLNFEGVPVEEIDALAYRRAIVLLLQRAMLVRGSVFDNVAMGLRFRGTPRPVLDERVDKWLTKLGIPNLRDRPAKRLSGGEAQRVSLARAFAIEPRVMLLDEPFAGLDPPSRWGLLVELKDLLRETHTTAVFVTHDLEEASMIGDRIAVLMDGELQQIGTPDEILMRPANPGVAAFTGSVILGSGRVLSAGPDRTTVRLDGLEIMASSTSFAPGDEVWLSVRPEQIRLVAEQEMEHRPKGDRLSARVTAIYPSRPLSRVRLDCGFDLVVHMEYEKLRAQGLTEGAKVELVLPPEALHLMGKEDHRLAR